MSGCLEHQLIVGWLSWLHQEDLYQCTCLLAEVHTCLNHLGVIENHQRALWQVLWQVIEDIIAHLAMIIHQELGVVSLCYRKLSDSLVWQIVVIVTNLYMFCIHFLLFLN